MIKSNKAGHWYIWKTVGYVRTYNQSRFGTKYDQTSKAAINKAKQRKKHHQAQGSKAEKEASSVLQLKQ